MNAVRPTRYPHIEVSGTPREMGRQIGEAAREQVRAFVEMAMTLVRKSGNVERDVAVRVARQSGQCAREYAPEMMEELEGIAEGAGVALDDVLLLQVRNQLPGPPVNACTSFAIRSSSECSHARYAAQNWDNDADLEPVTIVLTRRPHGKPALINITQAGLIAYIGLNDAGIGVCLNTLPSPSRAVGVPHYFTVRGIFESTNLEQAVHAVERARRAIGANILLATPQGPADLEVTIDEVRVLRAEHWLSHTNHCLDPQLVHYNEQFPELIQSGPRKRRIDSLLASSPRELADLKAALADHDDYPRSICRHPNDDPQHGDWTTVFSVVLDVDQGVLYASRGNPCEQPFERYDLHGAAR